MEAMESRWTNFSQYSSLDDGQLCDWPDYVGTIGWPLEAHPEHVLLVGARPLVVHLL